MQKQVKKLETIKIDEDITYLLLEYTDNTAKLERNKFEKDFITVLAAKLWLYRQFMGAYFD